MQYYYDEVIKKLLNVNKFLIVILGCVFLSQNAFSTNTQLIENENYSRFNKVISPLVHLKGKQSQKAIKIFPFPGSHFNTPWKIFRHYPSGMIEIQHYNGEYFKPILLPPGFALDSYIMLIFGDIKNPYLLVYNVTKNIPSGRKLQVTAPGYDLYQLTSNKEQAVKLVAQEIDIGGIDSLVYGHQIDSKVYLCAANQCVTVLSDGSKIKWKMDELENYEFVEVKFHNKEIYALVRPRHIDPSKGKLHKKNARLSLVRLSSEHLVNIVDIHDQGIPFNLQISESGKPSWDTANSVESFRNLLFYDLGRMLNNGWIDFGANNFEGRVAWSQVYYLHGMLSLLNPQSGLKYLADNKVRERLFQTIFEELQLLAELSGQDYPGYRVKRYSIDREPLLFALHLARITTLLKHSQSVYKNSKEIDNAISTLCTEMNNLNHTVEEILTQPNNDLTMRYKSGYPFWADGINVPYNFISGYVEGLITACSSDKNVKRASLLMSPLLSNIEENPTVWHYWGATGDKGWIAQDRLSINTPEWVGNKQSKAHITYRSMDASAILVLLKASTDFSSVYQKHLTNIKSLLKSGLLLPDVNQLLFANGTPVTLNKLTAEYYARSTAAWEIPSQIWALDALAAEKNKGKYSL